MLWWQDMSPGQQLVTGLIAANTAVYLVWRIPSMGPVLLRNTVLALPPLATRAHTMLTSAFTHISLTHLGCNMVPPSRAVLCSCETIAVRLTGGHVYCRTCSAVCHLLPCRRMEQHAPVQLPHWADKRAILLAEQSRHG